MAGESIAHNTIAQNFVVALRPALRGKRCQVIMETVQLAVEANRHYTYPDIVVSCDPQDQQERRRLHHPLLIVEVLSPSTEDYDRGLKFNQYKKLPSLRTCWYRKKPGWWSGISWASTASGATPPWPKPPMPLLSRS